MVATEYESRLLELIDNFLSSPRSFDDFVKFKDAYCDYRIEGSATWELERRIPPGLPPHDLGPEEAENMRLYGEELPRDRRDFFDLVAKRCWLVGQGDVDARSRSYGYVDVEGFVERLRHERGQYRANFARWR